MLGDEGAVHHGPDALGSLKYGLSLRGLSLAALIVAPFWFGFLALVWWLT